MLSCQYCIVNLHGDCSVFCWWTCPSCCKLKVWNKTGTNNQTLKTNELKQRALDIGNISYYTFISSPICMPIVFKNFNDCLQHLQQSPQQNNWYTTVLEKKIDFWNKSYYLFIQFFTIQYLFQWFCWPTVFRCRCYIFNDKLKSFINF